ncbi:MAG: SMP-30/gluconolactonase/LRE family protein [Ignavibacteria bacterium]
MLRLWLSVSFIFFICFLSFSQQMKTTGKIYSEDPALNDLIPENAVIEVLAEGFGWSEGPVWIKDGGFLLFTDIPQNTIFKWNEKEGLSVYLRPAGFSLGTKSFGGDLGSNGLFINPVNNQLILCDHGNRCITQLNRENWSKKIIIDSYEGKKFNSPNDVVISSNGHFYFTDPPYGLKGPDYPGKELDFSGVYHLSGDGKIELITKELDYPNGISLSPDEKTLYVSNSGEKKVILKFDVAENGSVKNGRLFFDATGFNKYGKGGGCDGMVVDQKGNIWATAPGGVMIFSPEGKHLGSIDTGTELANCKFGGKEGNELFIASHNYLCRVKVKVKGMGF